MNRGHILFVDDDVLAQWILSEVLDDAGYRVTSVCRAEEAVRLIESIPDFDLLLTDVALPDTMNGVDLADFWRLVQPGRPVIYTTSLARSMVGSLEEGESCMPKSFCGDELLQVVDEALEKAQPKATRTTSVRRSAWVH